MDSKRDLTHINEILRTDILIIPIITRPIFPHLMFPITFSGVHFIETIKKAFEEENRIVGLVLLEEKNDTNIFHSKLKKIGTVVKIHSISQISPNTIQVVVQGLKRFSFASEYLNSKYLRWEVTYYNEPENEQDDELKASNFARRIENTNVTGFL